MSNSDNPKKGKVFQQKVLELAKNKFQKSFIEEKVVKIGNPEKEHRFDCVTSDSSVIREPRKTPFQKVFRGSCEL